MLPEKVMREAYSLELAEERNTGITNLLKAVGCKDQIKVLQEISWRSYKTRVVQRNPCLRR